MVKTMISFPKKAHGFISSKGRLVKRGKSVVLFKIYDGFAIPTEVLKQIKEVEIHYGGEVYLTTSDKFWQHGINNDFEGEKQLVLPRKYWKLARQEELLK